MCFSPLLAGIFNGFSADGDEVIDGLPDGLTDESIDVQMKGSFQIVLMGIFIQEYSKVYSP